MAELEAAAMEAVRFQPPRYDPKMRRSSAGEPGRSRWSSRPRASAFSRPRRGPGSGAGDRPFKLAPVLYPLSGIPGEALPGDLPPFDAAVDAAMSSASWRFLIRLNSEGGVAECVSLENGGESGRSELEKWLRRIQFKPEPGRPFRWIAVGVGFTNQPVADGTDAR